MSHESESLMAVQKLNGENYRNWAFRVKNSLKYKRLWRHVLAEKVAPEDAEDDEQALSIISLACNDVVKDLVIDCKTAKEAWTILEETFVRKTPAAKVGLYCALTSLQCTNLAGVRELLDEFGVIVRKLQELRVEMDNDMYSIVLLRALPSSFEQFKVAMMTRDALPGLEEIKMKVEEERLRQIHDHPVAQEEEPAPMAMAVGPRRRSSRCFRCDKPGHFARDCSQAQSSQTPRGRSRPRETGRDQGRQRRGKLALFATILAATPAKDKADKWMVDSGCPMHVCINREMFQCLRSCAEEVVLPDGTRMMAEGIGEVVLETPFAQLELHDVWYMPKFVTNLFSVPVIDKKGCQVTIKSGAIVIQHSGKTVAEAALDESEQYVLKLAQTREQAVVCGSVNSTKKTLTLGEWHRRLGHLNRQSILKMSGNELVEGLQLRSTDWTSCEVCAKAKVTTEPYPRKAQHRASHVNDRIHSDVCEMPTPSFGGCRYFVTFVDDHSRYVRVYCVQKKSDVFGCWQRFQALVENQCGRPVKALRTDNGREYVNREFMVQLASCGIEHETSVPESPAQNGVAERMNRSLCEMVRCMLLDGQMPEAAWAEAIQTAAYIRNRSESASTPVTPFQLMFGRKPTMGHIQRFGAKVVALKRGRDIHKLRAKGETMRFCGYAPSQKGYRLLGDGGKLVISRSCRFLEEEEPPIQLDEAAPGSLTDVREEPEDFQDCVAEVHHQREQPARQVKVPVNYKDISSDDDQW